MIAKVVSLYVLILGISYVLNVKLWARYITELIEANERLFSLSLLVFLFGLIIVLNHNHWEWSPQVIVTLFGWHMLIKGVLILLFPGLVRLYEKFSLATLQRMLYIAGIVSTGLGLILCYYNFIA
jgi:hypothetical protein